jgi:hypothetical protein
LPFEIVVHDFESIVEVVYPEKPTEPDVDDYVRRIKRVIGERSGPWSCLVDQRKLNVMPDALYTQIAALNVYAQDRGMKQAARVVSSAVSSLQTSRMYKQSAIDRPIRTFTTRDDALAWLRR